MGTMVGNFTGILLIAIAALTGLISLQISAITLLVISYGLWVLFVAYSFTLGRMIGPDFLNQLLQAETKAFRKYNIHIRFPGAGEIISALLNILRSSGFVWAGICAWNELYVLAGLLVSFFFVSGGIILKTNPILYMGGHAANGTPVAIEQLALIEAVILKRNLFNNDEGVGVEKDKGA